MQVDLSKPRILQVPCYSASLLVEEVSDGLGVCVEYVVSFFRKVVHHCDGSWCNFDDSCEAAFDWVVYSDCARFFVYVNPLDF